MACSVVVLETATGRQVWSGETGRPPERLDVGWSVSPERIYFGLWNGEHRNQIACVQVRTGGEPRLDAINVQHEVWQVRPSSDGSILAYSHPLSERHPSVDAFSLLDVSTGKEQMVSAIADRAPCWSPEGTALVFVTPEREMWVADADGTRQRIVAQNVIGLTEGRAWTEAGWIAFRRMDGNVYRIQPDGSGESLLLDVKAFLEATGEGIPKATGTPH